MALKYLATIQGLAVSSIFWGIHLLLNWILLREKWELVLLVQHQGPRRPPSGVRSPGVHSFIMRRIGSK